MSTQKKSLGEIDFDGYQKAYEDDEGSLAYHCEYRHLGRHRQGYWEAGANAVADEENKACEEIITAMMHDTPSFEVEAEFRMLARKIAARRNAR